MFKNSKVLVTGGTGMIGRQLVKLLCDEGAQVKIATLDNINVDARVEHNIIDLTDFKNCKWITRDMDYVFHLMGVKGSPKITTEKPASFFVPMLMANTNVLEACRINKVKRVLYTSTIGAYAQSEILTEANAYDGVPMDVYPGWAKRMGELQILTYYKQYGLDNFAIVRPCNVYGPGDNFDENAMVIPSLMTKIHRGDNPVIVWGDGSAVRDIAYSEDIARGMMLAINIGGQVINLASGRGYSVKELVETLHSFIDFKYEFDTSKPTGVQKRIMDITLAKKLLGYEPQTSLLKGLKQTWRWYLENQDEYKKKKDYFR